MADQQQAQQHGQQAQHHGQQAGHHAVEGIKNLLPGGGISSSSGPSGSNLLAVATLVPVGGILLTLAGLTLTATVIGLAIATPLFVIFSPVLIPAAIAIGMAVTGFATSGAFGLTAITSLWGLVNYLRGAPQKAPQTLEYAKRKMGEGLQNVGQKTRETGQQLQSRAQDRGQEEGRK